MAEGIGKILSLSPGRFGIYVQFLILIISIIAAIICQHYVATRYINLSGWNESCPDGFEDRCKQNSSVFRFSFALTVLFGSQSLGTAIMGVQMGNRYFDSLWLFKFICYIATLVGFYFLPNAVFDDHGYAWYARIAGGIFVIYQQIILIDCAYRWNALWIEYGGGDTDEPSCWLTGLLLVSSLFFSGSLTAIAIMFWLFHGCPENEAIISLTLLLCVIATLLQLFVSDSGTLLASAIVMSYATFICYSSVTLNPNTLCNPTIATDYQLLKEVIGIIITIISLVMTTIGALRTLVFRGNNSQTNISPPGFSNVENNSQTVQNEVSIPEQYNDEGLFWQLQQVTAVFILISSYFAMVLTDWATIQHDGESADPKAGRVGLWIQVRSDSLVSHTFY